MTFSWGILRPEELPSARRAQDLGLAASVRHFNDCAVPGLGGLWFPMPLVWSVLAVALTEMMGLKSALPVGNAIEALMMSQVKGVQGGEHKGRVRGLQKLQSVEDLSFKNLTRPGVYVVQPIRMAMVQPLIELGFVTGSRYGAFRLGRAGQELLGLKEMQDWLKVLEDWVRSKESWASRKKANTDFLNDLSPLASLPIAIRKLIKERVLFGNGPSDSNAQRRHDLVNLKSGPSLLDLSGEAIGRISDEHWTDLQAGAAFMDLRDAALAVLSAIEKKLQSRANNNDEAVLTPEEAVHAAEDQLKKLKITARASRSLIEKAKDSASVVFTSECIDTAETELVVRLAKRDGSVIAWHQHKKIVIRGPAWDSEDRDMGTSEQAEGRERFAPQLFRLWNLHCLMQEINGKRNPRSPSYPEGASQ